MNSEEARKLMRECRKWLKNGGTLVDFYQGLTEEQKLIFPNRRKDGSSFSNDADPEMNTLEEKESLRECVVYFMVTEKIGVTHALNEPEDQKGKSKRITLEDFLEFGYLDGIDPSILIKNFPSIYDDELFRKNFHPNTFWTKQVMRYITGKDWARAWDELRRASNGIFHGNHRQDIRDPKYRGFFGATAKNVRDLIETLFWKMKDHGFPLTNPVESFPSPRFARSYGKNENGRLHQVAGFDVAYYIDNPEVKMLPEGNHKCFEFSETGDMALILGEHFRQEANRKKRERASAI